MAVVRELSKWRDAEAERRNQPARRILRDDLLDRDRQAARRPIPSGFAPSAAWSAATCQRYLPKLAECVEKALALKDDELPHLTRKSSRPQLNLLGQFLSTALGSICRSAKSPPASPARPRTSATSIAYRLNLGGFESGEVPLLAQGWRAEVVGQVIDHLLAGDLAVRIADPLADEPLVFERRQESPSPFGRGPG